jgi:very-short-patch-repair endonuclease
MNGRDSTKNPLPSRRQVVGEGFPPRSCASEALRTSHGGKGEGESSPAVARARALRSRMSDAERKLWRMLRDRQFVGAKFRRQVPLGRYVADFLSFDRKVVIEVNGGQHSGKTSDVARDNWFGGQGFTVVRFWNNDVLTNLDGVAVRLLELIDKNTPHPASQPRAAAKPPSPTRGEGAGAGGRA